VLFFVYYAEVRLRSGKREAKKETFKVRMKIVYLITGSGGSFYCGNCYRDMLYLRAIRKVKDLQATAVPLYLPPERSNTDSGLERKVFFGAISMYIREKVRFLRNMPPFLDKAFNAGPFLKLASRFAGTTRTEGLEELTLNMIEGDNAFRKHEMDRLITYLTRDGNPDIIHLSNALILGLARQLKKRMNISIICSLLNEDDWIEDMAEPFKTRAWELISREAVYVDKFITPSRYYKDFFINKTGIGGDNIQVVPLGFDPEELLPGKEQSRPLSIGYFSRVNSHNGFDKIVDAFIDLKAKDHFPGLTLSVCGGYTGDDKAFISEQIRKIKENGLQKSIKIYPEFQGTRKLEFFNDVDVVSVPVRKYDGYGLYILEANAAGVPVVQPDTGAFAEIISRTGGGLIYSPDTPAELSNTLQRVLADVNMRKELGRKGQENVKTWFSLEKMSEGLSEVYYGVKT
jgi:glycosyltransferase involved in cell wall biosynthesis